MSVSIFYLYIYISFIIYNNNFCLFTHFYIIYKHKYARFPYLNIFLTYFHFFFIFTTIDYLLKLKLCLYNFLSYIPFKNQFMLINAYTNTIYKDITICRLLYSSNSSYIKRSKSIINIYVNK